MALRQSLAALPRESRPGRPLPKIHAAPSETLRDSANFQRMGFIPPRLFTTQASTRKHLGGIRQLMWIEGATHALHGFEVRLGKHLRHHLLLFFADTVLASDRTARLDTQFQNACGERLGGFLLSFDARV